MIRIAWHPYPLSSEGSGRVSESHPNAFGIRMKASPPPEKSPGALSVGLVQSMVLLRSQKKGAASAASGAASDSQERDSV